jgi:hypothetical protein
MTNRKIIMTNSKHYIPATLKNDDGSVIVATLMVLVLVSIIGFMSIRTSSDDINISTNKQLFERSFYAAESARAFARNNPDLYGSTNITSGIIVGFPKANADPETKTLISTTEQDIYKETFAYISSSVTSKTIPGGQESFRGTVQYLTSSLPPRGSGFAVVKFRAHNYKMICEGHFSGISDTASRIEAGFYRIGF